MDVFHAIFVIGFLAGVAIRRAGVRQSRGKPVRHSRASAVDRGLLWLGMVGMVILPAVCLLTPWLDFADYESPIWVGGLGALTFAGGLWLLWQSHADLGCNWSATLEIRDGHTLVTEGVYRRIRHPMYAAHGLWGVAQLLLLHNWIAGPAMLVFLGPLYVMRAPREEQLMLEHFGEEYRAYMERTGRLIPRWRR